MALPSIDAIFDAGLNGYVARNTGTWANLTTWGSWTGWSNLPANAVTVTSQIVDRGAPGYFNLRTDITAVGNITYRVFTSTTGNFAGEETITTVTSGESNIAAFYGQYYVVEAQASTTAQLPLIENFVVTDTNQTLTYALGDLETAALTVSGSGRQITVGRTISAVTSVQITPHEPPAQAQTQDTENYYMETPEDNYLVPYIVSKSRPGPVFVLRNLNLGRTANMSLPGYLVDATVTVLPEQYHDGVNLSTR